MSNALVIGAGSGGLSAAIELAAAGRNVTVLEAGDAPGGKIGCATFEGVEFDTGPSLLTLPEVLDAVLKRANTSLADELTLLTPAPLFRYRWPDGATLDVAHAPEETLANIDRTFGHSAATEFRSFLDYTRDIWNIAAPPFIFGDAPSFATLMRMGLSGLSTSRKIDPMRTMWQAISNRVTEPHLRLLLARYATYNGSDPYVAPATLNCIAHVEISLGGYGVAGGMAAIARAFERVAKRLGVTFRYNTRVAHITVENSSVRGVVTTAGETFNASVIVSNADVAHLASDLLTPATPHDIQGRYEHSMSGWTATLKARRRDPSQRAAHEVLFSSDYPREFEQIFRDKRPPDDPTIYLCAQEKAHARNGWQDHEPLFVMINAPALRVEGETMRALYANVADRIKAILTRHNLIDPDDHFVWQRTPDDLAIRFPGSLGSIYGPSSNGRFAAFQRTANRSSRLNGLFVASGSAHPGGGVPLCVLSGTKAAEAALRHS